MEDSQLTAAALGTPNRKGLNERIIGLMPDSIWLEACLQGLKSESKAASLTPGLKPDYGTVTNQT